jgi:hypothetical protein
MSFLYTVTDAEREREQVQRIYDKLMEVPEGPKQ